ncbi:MAG: hypothetical protein NVSMB52_10060 [Chloroflexota bacterium]
MNTAELITLHFLLECVGIDSEGDLIPIPCPNPDGVPRFYIAQHTDDSTFSVFYRHDVPQEVRDKLGDLRPEEALHHHELVKSVLTLERPCTEFHYGKSYICPKRFTPDDFSSVVRLDQRHHASIQEYDARIDAVHTAVFAAIVDGKIVSTCESSRQNDSAAEAWVRTLPEYRGLGLAKGVTAAWAAHAWA